MWIVSSNRVRNEPPPVKLIYFPIPTTYDTAVTGTPGLADYGKLEADANGTLFGVAKWATTFVETGGTLNLLTAYKVGDLALQYVGQIQTRPTVVGYIEGAPPLPAENLTVDSPITPYKYLATSAITLTQVDNVEYSSTASRDRGIDQSYEAKYGFRPASI